jgi:hypothetical protein
MELLLLDSSDKCITHNFSDINLVDVEGKCMGADERFLRQNRQRKSSNNLPQRLCTYYTNSATSEFETVVATCNR